MTIAPPSFEQRQQWQQRPAERPVMLQSWENLLFLHWTIDPQIIQQQLPQGLTVDTFDDAAWIGIVPFEMRKIRPSWFPAVPYVSNFLELNVRTYVYDENGTPGVWFFSLAASRLLAVQVARSLFHLPYYWASMRAVQDEDQWIDYRCRRYSDADKQVGSFRYRPTGTPAPADERTLEFFLVERYILFAELGNGKLATGQVHHSPYRVQPAEVSAYSEVMLQLDGFPLPGRPPESALFSPGVDVEVFGLKHL